MSPLLPYTRLAFRAHDTATLSQATPAADMPRAFQTGEACLLSQQYLSQPDGPLEKRVTEILSVGTDTKRHRSTKDKHSGLANSVYAGNAWYWE